MEQAKNFVCRSCSTPVAMGHKFCGRCGAATPPEIVSANTQYFGHLQTPGQARLVLIRGEGVEGLSYQLSAEEHLLGSEGAIALTDDPAISPRHANVFYRDSKLFVKDEGSLNGVYVRLRGPVEVFPGDHIIAGEQVFRLEGAPKTTDAPGPDGTFFYASPKHLSTFRLVQLLSGGAPGLTVCSRNGVLQVGREGGNINFPMDVYLSAAHCRIDEAGGKFVLTDLQSRNGTYLRIRDEKELGHGDYFFLGRRLLRVEISAA